MKVTGVSQPQFAQLRRVTVDRQPVAIEDHADFKKYRRAFVRVNEDEKHRSLMTEPSFVPVVMFIYGKQLYIATMDTAVQLGHKLMQTLGAPYANDYKTYRKSRVVPLEMFRRFMDVVDDTSLFAKRDECAAELFGEAIQHANRQRRSSARKAPPKKKAKKNMLPVTDLEIGTQASPLFDNPHIQAIVPLSAIEALGPDAIPRRPRDGGTQWWNN